MGSESWNTGARRNYQRLTDHPPPKMYLLSCSLVVVLLVNAIIAQPWQGEEGYDDAVADYARPYGAMDTFQVERRSWCAEWGDYCRPNAKKKYAQCCPGMRCACGLLWGRSRCRCKGKIFGR